MKFNNAFLFLSAFCFLLLSCSEDDSIFETPTPLGDYQNGLLISHEGTGATETGSVSFISNDLSITRNDIYNAVNSEDLGLFQQSMTFSDSNAYIVVDNANTIAVVDRYTFESKAIITEDLQTPRYLAIIDGKGYVTNWGDLFDGTDDFIAVIDLTTNTVTTTIAVPEGPEQIIVQNDKLYVSHKGGFGTNNIITVIDANDNSTSEITVADNPDELFFDNSGALWVLCSGKTVYNDDFTIILEQTPGAIIKIDITTNTITQQLDFSGIEQPGLFAFENNTLYYTLNGGIYEISTSATVLPGTEIAKGSFYGMTVKDGKIYTTDAKDFSTSGTLNIYDLTTKKWSDPITVGVLPAKIYFN